MRFEIRDESATVRASCPLYRFASGINGDWFFFPAHSCDSYYSYSYFSIHSREIIFEASFIFSDSSLLIVKTDSASRKLLGVLN